MPFFSSCFTSPTLNEPEAGNEELKQGMKWNMEGLKETTLFFPPSLEEKDQAWAEVQGEDWK